jgi:putative transposase
MKRPAGHEAFLGGKGTPVGPQTYLNRATDSVGDTVEFWFSEHRDLRAAKRFFGKALERHSRPNRVVIDVSQTNREAIIP